MLSLQSGLKYRQKIEQKLSLAARKPTENLCDIDPLDDEIFQDKSLDQIAKEALDEGIDEKEKKTKKQKKKKKKATSSDTNVKSSVFDEILDQSDE